MPVKFSQKQIIIVVGAIVILGVLYFVITSNLRRDSAPPEVKLTVWGPADEKRAIQGILDGYGALRPNVKISYESVEAAGYREQLVNALAAGGGPDVFFIGNRSLSREINKLTAAPESQLGLAKFKELFPTVVEQDFVRGGKAYALPLYIDTLALVYNTGAFDQAAIASPPRTWNEFQQVIPYLRVLNANGQIVKAAAAIGGTEKTMKNAADLLSVIMMQTGAPMTDTSGSRADFSGGPKGAGLTAFNFYLQFANAASGAYTWNENQPYSMDAAGSGRTAMIFGYAADLAAIKKKNPLVSLGVAPLPQIKIGTPDATAVNYASYAGLAVSKQSKASEWAWDFVIYAATTPATSKSYLDATRRPPALRSLIAQTVNDPDLGVFARQALTARSWPQPDEARVRAIMSGAIGAALSGQLDSARGLDRAEDQITQVFAAVTKEN